MRLFFGAILLSFSFSAFAGYEKSVMVPWLGASQNELVQKWGYPQTSNDVVKIDDETTIFTYQGSRTIAGMRKHCVISFTLQNKTVTGYKVAGANCPKIKRGK